MASSSLDRRWASSSSAWPIMSACAVALMANLEVPHAVLREQLIGAVEMVLHLERRSDGSRGAVALAEVGPAYGGLGLREVWRRREDAGE